MFTINRYLKLQRMAKDNSGAEKKKALTLVLNQIERSFGKGAIVRLGDATRMKVETIPSGALTLDLALGGGLPKGRVIEIYGPESSGKTTLALHAIAEVQNAHMGLQARLMSQALRKITGNIGKSNCTVIFLNQLRQKIGVVYGNPETTTGGNALKFYASVRLDIRRIQTLKRGTDEYGIRAKVKVAKNKIAPPFRIAEFDIIFGKGISTLGCLVDLAEETGVLKRKGAWYSYNGDNIGQGRDKTLTYLEENATLAKEIEQKVRVALDSGAVVSANSVTQVDSHDDEDFDASSEEE